MTDLNYNFDDDSFSDKNHIVQHIFLACPSFKAEYERPDSIYELFGNWAYNIVESYRENRKEELSLAFALIERLHKDSRHEIQEAVTIGLLESIQNISGNNADAFLPYLGEESSLWWQALNDFWSGKKSTV